MLPTDLLMHEHEIILMVLDAVDRDVAQVQVAGHLNVQRIEKMIDFFRNFADRCHHAKEENYLFERMRQRGFPAEAGPIAVMLSEHDEGRMRLRNIEAALPDASSGNAAALKTVAENLAAFAFMLRNHIGKEDNILYPMANQVLTEDDQKALDEAFERVEKDEIGAEVHEKYHQMAHELAGKN